MIGKKINQLATELAPVSTDLTIIGDPVSGVSKKITLAQLGAIFSGAVSFYTNLAAFPVVGDINVIYCAKDTQKLYLWSGSAYTEVFPSQALLNTYQLRSEKGVSNGYASLDSGGKVPISQLPSSIMEYKGTWSASTNTPTLANGTGDTGDVYICNSPGSVNFGAGAITFAVGDYVIYSGTIWQRSSGAVGTVTSVAVSRSGDALAITGSPITTSGTINLGFAGNSTQYINGAGNLVTFPGIINEAQNLITEVYNKTGATLTKGTVVYINGGQGNLPAVTKALATGDSTSAQTYGIVRNDITNNNNGYVVVAGRISDLDTQAYTEGTQLYLSPTTAGTYTSTKPYAPNHLVYVGIVVRAHPTQGVIEVKIQNGYEMDELHNVAAQTPSNNDGLFWEASTSLWKNKSIATILGGTPITGSGNVNAIPKFTANSVLGNSVMEDDGNFVSMRGLKLNASAGVGNTINFQQASGITAAGLGYSTIGAAGSTGIQFYLDQNVTERIFIFDTATITSNTARTYSMPDSSGTLALVSQLTGGTVTSVGLSSATSGVTIGSTPITTSGTITLAIATASGSQQGLLSSTDWTTFNNKQSALTNPVTGTGTTNYLPKFTGTSTIGNSGITDDNTTVTYGAGSGLKQIYINGGGYDLILGASGGGVFGFTSTNISLVFSTTAKPLGIGTNAAQPLIFGTSAAERMRLDASGNLGLGVTPSAWGSTAKAIEFTAGSIESRSTAFSIWANGYYDGASSKYVANGFASNYYQFQGQHIWLTAPSGTAGNAISFTQAMTLNASGNLSVGNTNDTYKLDVSGTGRFSGALRVNAASTIYGATQDAIQTIFTLGGQNASSQAKELYFRLTAGGTPAWTFQTAAVGTDTDINIYPNGNNGLKITYAGAATFSSSVRATGLLISDDRLYMPGNQPISNWFSSSLSAGYSSSNSYAWVNGATNLVLGTDGTERMRITSGGQLLVRTTSTPSASVSGFCIEGVSSGNISSSGASTSAYNHMLFYNGNGLVGFISTSGSTTTYSTSSDYRLKSDYKDYSGLDLINKIKTYDYEWKSDKTRSYGVIAHELQSVINYAVTGVKDGKEMQGVDYSKIVPVLIKAIQELNDKIK